MDLTKTLLIEPGFRICLETVDSGFNGRAIVEVTDGMHLSFPKLTVNLDEVRRLDHCA
ncbi:MAG: hypothetical protein MIN69_21260 [Methylorubrum extorquens]|jgi:hypothetical protein|uniref:hypothetical protein n=1 Tax=Methylorubrum extorquens TaxID=408 RepID=UPI002FEE40E4